ncbi:hypothetical protein ACFU8Q_36215 [Streptomyces sp. NPDC057543]|uniref:hypothetical protein n=1 Tax=Streptomyces sp. NPDC057543 TaxID=3346163 RepID=UPI0036C794DA
MSNTPQHDANHLAYPEPPASPLWHRDGPKARPLTPEQQRRNRELLALAQKRPTRPRSPRSTNTLAEASGGRQPQPDRRPDRSPRERRYAMTTALPAQRTVLERFRAGHPRSSWPADEHA